MQSRSVAEFGLRKVIVSVAVIAATLVEIIDTPSSPPLLHHWFCC